MSNVTDLAPSASPRLPLIDALRGVAILAMVAYHLAWDLYVLGLIDIDVTSEPGWLAFQRSILSSFLLLAGAGLVLGHGRGVRWPAFWRRFGIIVGAGLLTTIGTYIAFPDYFVFFGVLQAIALFSLLALAFLRIPLALVLGIAIVVIGLPALFTDPAFMDRRLAWIGFWPEPPMTTDIVPIFPWFGATLIGVVLMRALLGSPLFRRLAGFRAGPVTRWLAIAGRWSLVIYLVHQPLLYGGLSLYVQTLPQAMPTQAEAFSASCRQSCAATGAGPQQCERYCSCAVDIVERDNLWDAVNATTPTPERERAVSTVQRLCQAMSAAP